jgi:hypothetical protein
LPRLTKRARAIQKTSLPSFPSVDSGRGQVAPQQATSLDLTKSRLSSFVISAAKPLTMFI